MPVSDQYIRDVDLDTEEDETLIAQKISSEISQSKSYWAAFKELCTELYFDLLAYKETIRDATKSNTFIPLSYVDIMINKARIKKMFLSARPVCRVKPNPYNPLLSHKLSHFAQSLLDEAGWEKFLDILIQDALTYTGAIFQVTWGIENREMPSFEMSLGGTLVPKFDPESGQRAFENQEVREGLFLENINLQDFYLPKNARDAETDPWCAKTFSPTFTELQGAVRPDGTPKYFNLERLYEAATQRSQSSEKTRQGQALKRDDPGQPTFVATPDIIEFCTDRWIFYMPDGEDYIIGREENDNRKKPFHIGRVELLNGEPFGFSPNRANHLMSRTYNEIVDVVMDGLFLEDNKAWVVNEELIDDFEIGASQNNLMHVKGLDPGMDVSSAIKAIETRAIAPEILPLLRMFDETHQLVAARPNSAAGVPSLGAETAYENALLEEGSSVRILDMAQNLVATALKPIYEDIFHLAKVHMAVEKSMEILGDNGELIETLTVGPLELVYSNPRYVFEFIGKERAKMNEQMQYVNLLQVWGNMINVDPVSVLLMKNLLINTGIPDLQAVQQALDESIQQRQMIQLLEMQLAMQTQQAQAQRVTDRQGPQHQASSRTANATNPRKPVRA
jgi:hypothetical protein